MERSGSFKAHAELNFLTKFLKLKKVGILAKACLRDPHFHILERMCIFSHFG